MFPQQKPLTEAEKRKRAEEAKQDAWDFAEVIISFIIGILCAIPKFLLKGYYEIKDLIENRKKRL